MTYQPISNRIFSFIETKFFTSRKNLLDEIGKILNLQSASIYKIHGPSSLSLEEAEILCRHFRISLDEILGIGDDKIYFDFPALYGSVANESDYLEPVKLDLEMIYRLDPLIYYATKELPIFYYLSSPNLVAFKFYVFNNFIWKAKSNDMLKFNANHYLDNSEFRKLVDNVLELYSTLNSIEIWNTSVLDNTFNQLKYFLDAGLMEDSKQAIAICDDLDKLIDKIAEMIKSKNKSVLKKSKKDVGTFNLYNNEIAHTNNVIFVKSETRDAVYSTYDSPNFMRSISPALCEYTDKWFQKIILNSVPITNGNLKDQSYFIHKLKEKLKRTRNSIQLSLQSIDE
ncbi:MAG: hypothetical protein ABIO44_06625 [Saprospiraceae bacterium]